MAEFHIKTSETGKLQGPFSGAQLKKLAEQGKLRPEHLVSANGGASWHPATRVAGLEFCLPHPSPQRPPPPPMPPQPSEDGPDEQSLVQLSVSKRTLVVVGTAFGLLCVAVGIGVLLIAGRSDEPVTDGKPTGGVTSSGTSQPASDTTEQVVLTTPVGVWRTAGGRTITITPTRLGPVRQFIDKKNAWFPIKSITHVEDLQLDENKIAVFEILLTGRVAGVDPGDFFVVRVLINLTKNFGLISFVDPDEHAKGIIKVLGKPARMDPVSHGLNAQ
jgi:hypothetical protein